MDFFSCENLQPKIFGIFDKDEISDAKEELWGICGESFLGRMVKRQGSGKSKSELDEKCIALKKLSEDNSVPLF